MWIYIAHCQKISNALDILYLDELQSITQLTLMIIYLHDFDVLFYVIL